MDVAPERVLWGCKSNCGVLQLGVESRMTSRALKLPGRIPPITGG
jgi:hypothetical protein